jgi:DNA-binding NarL/FixJ family response regulator
MKTALLIEAEKKFRDWLKDNLVVKFPELDVIETASADEAMRSAHIFRPDLIILDMVTVGDDVLRFAGQLRESSPAAKIIVLNNDDSVTYREAANNAAVDYVLTKDMVNMRKITALFQMICAGDDNTTSRRIFPQKGER